MHDDTQHGSFSFGDPGPRSRVHSCRLSFRLALFQDVRTAAETPFHVSRADSRKLLPDVIDLVVTRRLDPLTSSTLVARWEQAPEAWLESSAKLVLVRYDPRKSSTHPS